MQRAVNWGRHGSAVKALLLVFTVVSGCGAEAPSTCPFGNFEIPYDSIDNDCNPATPDDDLDGDGLIRADDCDDLDDQLGGEERPFDSIDNDCNPDTLDRDGDQDGVDVDRDCDDADPTKGDEEIPGDGIDNDCNPATSDTATPPPMFEFEVEGRPFQIQGVNWSPAPRGAIGPSEVDFRGFVDQDSRMMAAAGINVIRTFAAITDRTVLDTLYSRGIYVFMTIDIVADRPASLVRSRIAPIVDHPAILVWLIGNEWNYNGFYLGLDEQASIQRIQDVLDVVRELDTQRPIATVYGETPPQRVIDALPDIDMWGINAYRSISFWSLFDDWSAMSDKPMFLAEFGADAYNTLIGREDQEAQARATRALIGEIDANAAITGDGPCLGGIVFEWSDEWWKGQGDPNVHDTTGEAPGGGPYPDDTFNEEWWGLVDIDRRPRVAYRVVQEIWR